jgi:hypothetical protein
MMAAATTEHRMMGHIIRPPARTISHIGPSTPFTFFEVDHDTEAECLK